MKHYSKEIKEKAISEYLEAEQTVDEICEKYGMSRTSFYNWLYQYYGSEPKKTHKYRQCEIPENAQVREVSRTGRPLGYLFHGYSLEQKKEVLDKFFKSGMGVLRFSETYGFSSSVLYRWKRAFEEEGLEGLQKQK